MYQWSNTATGTVQLSGSPPAWYRSTSPGPRVFVFDNGQLVDDTSVSVPEEQRQLLRANAFGVPEASASINAQATHGNALGDTLENTARAGTDMNTVPEAFTAKRTREAKEDKGMVEQTVAELKALIDAWDTRRLNDTKALLREGRGR